MGNIRFPKQLTFKDQSCNGLVYDKKDQFIIAGFNEGMRNSMPMLSEDEPTFLMPMLTI